MDEDSGNAQAGDINNSASSYAPEQPAFYIRLFDDSDWGGGNSNSSSSGQPGGYWRRNTDAGSQGSNSPQVSGRLEVEVAEEEEAAAVVEPEHEAEDNTLENELMMDDGDEGELGEDSDTTNDSVFHRHPNASGRHPRSAGTSRTSRSSSSNDSWHQQYRQTSSRFGTVHEASHRPQAMAENYGEDEDDDDEMEGHSMKYRRTEESVEREKRLKTYKIKNYQIFKGHRNARTVVSVYQFGCCSLFQPTTESLSDKGGHLLGRRLHRQRQRLWPHLLLVGEGPATGDDHRGRPPRRQLPPAASH